MDTLVATIETGQGKVRWQIEVPEAPITLAELAAVFLPLDDQLVQLAHDNTAAAGKPSSCREGCAACCRQLVPLSPPEAFLLAEVIMARGDKDAVLDRFARTKDRVDRSWVGYALRTRKDLDKLVKATLKKLAAGAKFEKLMSELSEDDVTAGIGIAYEVSENGPYPEPLVRLALRLGTGETGVVRSHHGIHIVYREE